ncbi:MAG TPA: aspartate--tRNA ligase, partial [Alphaproteobacteria bacterium]|nr:aspartate--tRNA ligase [Alphaproteobacteria bacterium]
LTQCVVEPDADAFKDVEHLRAESVITVTGRVVARDAETVNPGLDTGQVEVRIDACDLMSAAEELPLPVFGEPHYP